MGRTLTLFVQVNTQLSDFVDDAMRLVLANMFIIDSAPLQLYSSVLAFAPQRSAVRERFDQMIPSWISLWLDAEMSWS